LRDDDADDAAHVNHGALGPSRHPRPDREETAKKLASQNLPRKRLRQHQP
jgi:hypothetical protein